MLTAPARSFSATANACARNIRHGDYQGFNSLLWDTNELVYTSNQGITRTLGPGYHGLTNAELGAAWPKVTDGLQRLRAIVEAEATPPAIIESLANESVPLDANLPQRGRPLEWERRLAPCFIRGNDYGTRASTAIIWRDDQATLTEQGYGPGGRALGRAERAVAAGPDDAAAHLAAARVMGRHGQTLRVSEASGRGYAEKIRAALDRALALDPGSLQARIGMALWHTQVVDAAGPFLARIVYGARAETAYELFEQAVARAPDERRLLFEYARALKVLGGDTGRARRLLRHALAAPARDALDRIVGERAAALLAELEAGG